MEALLLLCAVWCGHRIVFDEQLLMRHICCLNMPDVLGLQIYSGFQECVTISPGAGRQVGARKNRDEKVWRLRPENGESADRTQADRRADTGTVVHECGPTGRSDTVLLATIRRQLSRQFVGYPNRSQTGWPVLIGEGIPLLPKRNSSGTSSAW